MKSYFRISAACLALLSVGQAAADPLRFKTPSQCVTEGGSTINLDPGYYLSDDDWNDLDDWIRSAQNDRTRETAIEEYLRSRRPSNIGVAALSLAAGVALGLSGKSVWQRLRDL